MFDGSGGPLRREAIARVLAERCPAVTQCQAFRSSADAPPLFEVDFAWYAPAAAFVDVEHAAVQTRLAAS